MIFFLVYNLYHVFLHHVESSWNLQPLVLWICLLTTGIFFALATNALFGHPTCHAISNQPLPVPFAAIVGHRNKPSYSGQFQHASKLPEAVLLHVSSFLNAYEVLQLMKTNKDFRRLTNTSALWDSLIGSCISQIASTQPCSAAQIAVLKANAQSSKEGFFGLVALLSPLLLQCHIEQYLSNNDKAAFVIIHKRIYNLTGFMDEHPGGAAIIQEFHGRDASKMFDRAFHSRVAKQLAKKFLVWDPSVFVGMPIGSPAFLFVCKRKRIIN